jgi:MFS family permease
MSLIIYWTVKVEPLKQSEHYRNIRKHAKGMFILKMIRNWNLHFMIGFFSLVVYALIISALYPGSHGFYFLGAIAIGVSTFFGLVLSILLVIQTTMTFKKVDSRKINDDAVHIIYIIIIILLMVLIASLVRPEGYIFFPILFILPSLVILANTIFVNNRTGNIPKWFIFIFMAAVILVPLIIGLLYNSWESSHSDKIDYILSFTILSLVILIGLSCFLLIRGLNKYFHKIIDSGKEPDDLKVFYRKLFKKFNDEATGLSVMSIILIVLIIIVSTQVSISDTYNGGYDLEGVEIAIDNWYDPGIELKELDLDNNSIANITDDTFKFQIVVDNGFTTEYLTFDYYIDNSEPKKLKVYDNNEYLYVRNIERKIDYNFSVRVIIDSTDPDILNYHFMGNNNSITGTFNMITKWDMYMTFDTDFIHEVQFIDKETFVTPFGPPIRIWPVVECVD